MQWISCHRYLTLYNVLHHRLFISEFYSHHQNVRTIYRQWRFKYLSRTKNIRNADLYWFRRHREQANRRSTILLLLPLPLLLLLLVLLVLLVLMYRSWENPGRCRCVIFYEIGKLRHFILILVRFSGIYLRLCHVVFVIFLTTIVSHRHAIDMLDVDVTKL